MLAPSARVQSTDKCAESHLRILDTILELVNFQIAFLPFIDSGRRDEAFVAEQIQLSY
jgi:hypothetical protein